MRTRHTISVTKLVYRAIAQDVGSRLERPKGSYGVETTDGPHPLHAECA